MTSDSVLKNPLDTSLPSWFKPEKFLEPEFSAEKYVIDLKRYVPLETLSGELQSHVTALKNKLVEVVNNDYNDFVSLSTKLVNVDGAVLRMQKPLLEIKDKVEAVRKALLEQATELQQGLQRRQGVAAARELLELLQDTVHVMSKVEKLLGEVQPQNGASEQQAGVLPAGEELEGTCRLLDRVCGEVSRLNFYTAKGQDLLLVQNMRPRIQAATSRLQAELGRATRAVLQDNQATALAICLHAYSALGVPQAAEQVVRQCLVTPTVRAALVSYQSKHHTPAGSTAGSSHPAVLPQLLPGLVEALQGKLSSVLSQALAASSASQSFDFLGGAVLPDITAELEESLPGVFSPCVPSVFHANYLAGIRLLDSLESQCTSTPQVQRFRQSAAYEAFAKKWSLPVFFSLQFQDIADGLESLLALPTLTQAPPSTASPGRPAFALAPTASVWKALQQTMADDIFLPQLADRFIRLAMQLLARYSTWIQQGIQQRAHAQQAASAAAIGGGQQAVQTQTQCEPGWAEAANLEQLSSLLQDVKMLTTAVLELFVPAVIQKVQGMIQEASEAVVMAFQSSSEELQQAGRSVLAALASTLTEQCVGVLKQLRGIVATFRMTKRSQPDRPSHYVSAILSPLQTFLQAAASHELSKEARTDLAQAVVAGISARYQQLAEDTLDTVRKTESSLKRLKTRQKAGAPDGEGSAAGPAADTDKMIAMQLLLDVQEFGRLATAAGVEVSRVQAYQQLWGAVATRDVAE